MTWRPPSEDRLFVTTGRARLLALGRRSRGLPGGYAASDSFPFPRHSQLRGQRRILETLQYDQDRDETPASAPRLAQPSTPAVLPAIELPLAKLG